MKYKLIKKFPNSPKLGTIIKKMASNGKYTDDNGFYIYENVLKDYFEFWEEVGDFKVGDIVVIRGNFIDKVKEVYNCQEEGDMLILEKGRNGFCKFNQKDCGEASDDEIISYYENQGWVKGAKFKHKIGNEVYTIDKISFSWSVLLVYSQEENDFVQDIEKCELIKEENYPKSWEELNCTDANNLLSCIKNLINLYGKEKFKQEWDL